jgi:hypothetical protein
MNLESQYAKFVAANLQMKLSSMRRKPKIKSTKQLLRNKKKKIESKDKEKLRKTP